MSDTLTVHVAATADDYAAAQTIFSRERLNTGRTWLWLLPSIGIMSIVFFALPAVVKVLFRPPGGVEFLSEVAAGIFAYLMSWQLFITFGYKPPLDPNGSFLTPTDIELAPDGVHWSSKRGEGRTNWSAVHKIEETKQHTYIFVDRAAVHVLPKRNFATPEAATAFVKLALQYFSAGRAPTSA